MRFDRVEDWLQWLGGLHPTRIDLGLERVARMAARLDIVRLPFPVVVVAGTNGKGSTVALLAAALAACGRRVGAYTSPALMDFSDCLLIGGERLARRDWLRAFDRVDRVLDGETLTEFEFQTLAAGAALEAAAVDVALLEVGLGGARDAVNAYDADIVVYTAIDIDHTELLGDTREAIALEKAGLLAPGMRAICADPDAPRALVDAAAACGASLLRRGVDFDVEPGAGSWSYRGPGMRLQALPRPGIPGAHQVDNAAGALAALSMLVPADALDLAGLAAALAGARLPGRQQIFAGSVTRIVDVAHNVQSAQALAATLTEPAGGRTRVVLGMRADKDVDGVVAALSPVVDEWFLASLAVDRGAPAQTLERAVRGLGTSGPVTRYPSPEDAWRAARAASRDGDRVVACGSFHTARAALRVESCEG